MRFARNPGSTMTASRRRPIIDPSAHLEDGVIVDPLAVIGPRVEIGAGTVIGAGAVIGADVKIGRDCNVGARTAIQFALIGNNVLIHPGCSIGQDGYGFIFFGPEGHLKVPQTGRVLIQNDVEIGAGTTIDRGSLRDTVIGEGTKIDNQVQIGHNVTIGRHCLLAAQIGLAGSLTIGDNVALGAKVGINNHLKIGDGAQVTAMSGVKDDIPPNGRWGGFFAKPTKQWFREIIAVERLVQRGTADPKGEGGSDGGGTGQVRARGYQRNPQDAPAPLSDAADRPGDQDPDRLLQASASRTSPSTSRRFSAIFRTVRSIPA